MSEFRMPSLGADMENGTLVEWLVQPGDRVRRGQVVCVVETQKGAVEVEIWESGVVDTLLAKPGQTLPVGAILAAIRGEGEAAVAKPGAGIAPEPSRTKPGRKPEEGVRKQAARDAKHEPAKPSPAVTVGAAERTETGGRLRMSPAARRRVQELGIDPAVLAPTGPGGVVCLADVDRASATVKAAPDKAAPSVAATAPDGARQAMREAIAAAMSRSNREIPHYYLGTSVNVEAALGWLQDRNERLPVADRAIFPVLQLRAVALALRDVPALNGWYRDGAFHAAEAVHLGVAIALRGGGLVAPALRDADTLGIDEMTVALRDLLMRARANQLRSSELTETSITVTNLGDLGVETVYGVIYPPQVALVGFGRVVERPWAENGMLGAARCLDATLAADHRATDGAIGARFLARVADYLKEPETLWKN